MNKKRLKRVGKRILFYMRQGYSLASLPFAFLGYASSIYYLAIENNPILSSIFPRFSSFLIIAAVTLPILCCWIGYLYMKRLWFFREAQEIQIESNPYAREKLTPLQIPIWKLWRELARREGLLEIVDEIDRTIKRSQK